MDPPPLSTPPTTTPTAAPPPSPPQPQPQPDSTNSTPRSRATDSWDDPPTATTNANTATTTTLPSGPTSKLRLMCSYGGHIIPRPHDKSLCYIGGDTRIIVVDRQTSLSEFQSRLSKTIFNGKPFTLKYQLPSEDLDSLISITTDEDLENMIDEYDRLSSASNHGSNSSLPNMAKASKTNRLRLFLFPNKTESSASSIESLLETSSKSEDWFLEALNGVNVVSHSSAYSESNSSVNCLLGLDDAVQKQQQQQQQSGRERDLSQESLSAKDKKDQSENNQEGGTNNLNNGSNFQDVHSVPDSPMLDTTSSFGSTSSMPSLANLPPIRVHVEESGQGQKVSGGLGFEEQFQQMSVGVGAGASPPAPVVGPVVTGVPVTGGGSGAEYVNRVFSDDERSEQGVPIGYRRVQQVQPQIQQQQPPPPAQYQQKPAGFVDLPSPDSVSSDGSVTNPLSRQRQMAYQEQVMQMQAANSRASANLVDQKMSDPNNRIQMQQPVQEPEYVIQSQYEQHPQLHQQQQFVHAGVQYIHPHAAGGMAMASYYPMYPSQQQHHPQHPRLEQQYVYYVQPNRPAQAYNMPVQQQSYGESPTAAQSSQPQAPPPAAMIAPATAFNPALNVPASKPEMAAGVYRTSAAGAPQMVQMHSSQHQQQYVGYPQMHHPSQSVPPASGAASNYAYEYAEPTHAQVYYTQPMAPQMAAQYQTVTSGPGVMLSGAPQVPTENMKQQNSNSQL